jgi:predicted membrane protein
MRHRDFRDQKLRKERSKPKMLVLSTFLLSAGVLLILGNLGIVDKDLFEYIFSWQALLIAFGLFLLAGGFREHWFGAFIMISVGSLFLLDEIFVLQANVTSMIWPAILILVAIGIFVRILFPNTRKKWMKSGSEFHGNTNEVNNDEFINVSRVFSGANVLIQSENFKGGKASFVFGGGEFDLRSAKLANGINILKIECVFGGVKLFLPEDWDVTLETTGVFGGFNDERRHVQIENIDRTKKLIIKAEAVFGGGEIHN